MVRSKVKRSELTFCTLRLGRWAANSRISPEVLVYVQKGYCVCTKVIL